VSDLEQDFKRFIDRVERAAVGKRGEKHFMPTKHEHWKFIWAAERITELEQENAALKDEPVGEIAAQGEMISRVCALANRRRWSIHLRINGCIYETGEDTWDELQEDDQ
jgi:hypothetical protein